jgi:hypothetical protein
VADNDWAIRIAAGIAPVQLIGSAIRIPDADPSALSGSRVIHSQP